MDKEIKKFEELGVNCMIINDNGRVVYKTDKDQSLCTNCKNCRVLPDPDPDDWFNDDDVKIHCTLLNKDIACSLRPYEASRFKASEKICPKNK